MCHAASSQIYSYDPSRFKNDSPWNIYFGVVKDERGARLANATIILELNNISYVFTTDEQGAFRGELPTEAEPEQVKAVCSKRGYTQIRLTKRRPVDKGHSPIQVDCVLARKPAATSRQGTAAPGARVGQRHDLDSLREGGDTAGQRMHIEHVGIRATRTAR